MKLSLDTVVSSTLAIGVAGALWLAMSMLDLPVGIGTAQAVEVPPPTVAMARAPAGARQESVVFAGGCFWGVQGVFQHVQGVTSAVSGYAGGIGSKAHYDRVSRGDTGHAESVKVTYDPSRVTYGQLMQVFFSVVHDPTQLNYQGPDHGTQYRSAVFASTPAQRAATQAYIAQLGKAHVFRAPIVTQVNGAMPFYPAESHHQNYLTLNPDSGYIRMFDLPKVEALKRMYPALYRAKPVLVPTR